MNTQLGTVDALRTLPLERALQYTSVGMAACDVDGRLTLVSPVLEQILGHGYAPVTEDEYAGSVDLVDENGHRLSVDAFPLVRARRGEHVRDELLIARRADGRLCHLRCNAAPLEDEYGEIAGAVVLVQDVTGELEARAAAAEIRQVMLERVHHEFRTPLATLLGHVELLEEGTDLPAGLEASLRAISRSGDRLSELLAHLDELVGQPPGRSTHDT